MNSFRRGEPNRYRTMDLSTWELIRHQEGDAIKLLMYYWFGPLSTPLGILRAPDGYACTDLGWNTDRLANARNALEEADLVWRDVDLLVLVRFLACNCPANPNIVKGWARQIAILPDSPLFAKLYDRASEWITPEGLAFLSGKLKTPSETLSKQFPKHCETLSKLRDQGSGNRDQGIREQGDRGEAAGESEGRGEGKEPAAGLRSASPREAASLRPASLEANPDGEQEPASNGRTTAEVGQQAGMLRALKESLPNEAEWLSYVRRSRRYSEEVIEQVRRELWPAANTGNGRCSGLTRGRLECTRRPVPGSQFCRFHQGQIRQ